MDWVNWDELIALYSIGQERRNLSKSTIGRRRRAIEDLTRSRNFQPTRECIEQFLDGRGLVPKSRAVYLSHYGCFFRWCIREELLDEDPTAKIEMPKLPRRMPRPVLESDLADLLADATPRIRAMLLLGALAGLRCMEIAGLDRRDVRADGSLRVIGKGDKERIVPIHVELQEALDALPLPESGPVFLRPRGGRATPDSVSHELGSHLRSYLVEGGGHRLRHTFGTEFYRLTQDLILTRDLMGHADIASTTIYAAADMTKASAAIAGLRRSA